MSRGRDSRERARRGSASRESASRGVRVVEVEGMREEKKCE